MVMKTRLLTLVLLSAAWFEPLQHQASAQRASGVAILQVDTDRHLGTIDRKIYGQFLEHINHSVVDGLFAEQIRGAGFEGKRLRDLLDDPSGRRAPCASSRCHSSVARRACG